MSACNVQMLDVSLFIDQNAQICQNTAENTLSVEYTTVFETKPVGLLLI